MEDNNIQENFHGKSKQINDTCDLLAIVNSLVLKSTKGKEVLMITSKLRFLTLCKENGDFFCEEQKELNNILGQTLNSNEAIVNFNLKLLLISSPFRHKSKKEFVDFDTTLQALIEAGADVRYKKVKKLERIVILKNELVIGESPNILKIPNYGIYYITNDEDFLVKTYKNYFLSLFNSAKKLGVKNYKLYYTDSLWKRIKVFFIEQIYSPGGIFGFICLILTILSLCIMVFKYP